MGRFSSTAAACKSEREIVLFEQHGEVAEV
jgi:hypothetical protein